MASGANLINSNGQVVGEKLMPPTRYHAAIWDPVNGVRDLNTAICR